jgi:hypothetical protein
MNFTENKLVFLSSYWNSVKIIGNDIKNDLPDNVISNVEKKSKHFGLVSYKDLNNWDVRGLLNNKSNNLNTLADKILYMINKGDAINIEPMLRRICFKGIKKLSQVHKYSNNEFLGYGHFRWNYRVYVLKNNEIERIINYFKL